MASTESAAKTSVRQRRSPSVEGVLRWMDLMETCEQLLLAGLRRKIGPDGDLAAAYRAWNARQMARRDRELPEMLSPARRLGKGHAD
jgi:hypothetical protein